MSNFSRTVRHIPQSVAIIGVTGHLGHELFSSLARQWPKTRFTLFARADSEEHLHARLDAVLRWSPHTDHPETRSRTSYALVDLGRRGLGLDPRGRSLLAEADDILLLASNVSFTMTEEEAVRANVDTIRHIIDTVSDLRRDHPPVLHYVSTAYVATTESDRALPVPVDPKARFRNTYEYSKAFAEQLIRESGFPFQVYRPSIIVGSSVDGRARGFDTVYNFVRAYARGRLPFVPAEPGHRLDIVPSDHVADVIAELVQTHLGGTFHISAGDDAPTARQLYLGIREAVAAHQGDPGPELRFFSPDMLSQLETAPPNLVSAHLRRVSRLITAYLPFLGPRVPVFDTTATTAATGLRPPSLDAYGKSVWAYALENGLGSPRRTRPPGRRGGTATAAREVPPTPDGLVAEAARRTPGATALVAGNTELTYAELESGVAARARLLVERSIRPGTRVALPMAQEASSVIALLGALRAGANVLLLPVGGRPPAVWGPTATLTPDGDLLDPPQEGSLSPHPGGIAFATSGTTGPPKLVQHPSGSLTAGGRSTSQALRLNGSERVVLMLPLFHAFATAIALPAALDAGASVALPATGHSGLEAVSRTRATHVIGVPTHFHEFLEEWRERVRTGDTDIDLSEWSVGVCGDDPVLPALRDSFERTFLRPLAQGYGLSEALLLCLGTAVEPDAPDCVGAPLPGVGIRVLDPSGAPSPQGRPGRIWVSAPTAMTGYVGAPERRSEWIDTGDIGWLDPAGRLHVSGRRLRGGSAAEVARVAGADVAVRAIENVLLGSDLVRRVKVLLAEGTAHAFVVPQSGARGSELHRLSDLVDVPLRVTAVPHLAQTPVGKVDRTALSRMIG